MSAECSGHQDEVKICVAGATDFIIGELTKLALEVSVKRSVTLADKLSTAKAIARMSKTGKITAVRQSEFLGTSAGGGRRRSTKALAVRLPKFVKKIGKIHVIRRAG
eukprot:9727001-Karenia_brevis.AAC.1